MAVRLPLPRDEDLDPEAKELISLLRLNVFRMLGNVPTSIKPFVDMGGSVLLKSEFDPRKREIAILRVAHVTKARYVWHHHVAIGKAVGITDDEIEKIAWDRPVASLEEEDNLICRVADEISREVRLSDDALAKIIERYGSRGAAELIMACCWFNLVSRFTESTRVEIESA